MGELYMEDNELYMSDNIPNDQISQLKTIVSYKGYFERNLNVELEDPHNDDMIGFSLAVENTYLNEIAYNEVLGEIEYEMPHELSEHLEELDVIYAQALLIKLLQSERIHGVYWKPAVMDGTFIRILKRFELEIENLEANKNYYVYALVDPTNDFVPFYIGKGVNKRVWNHFVTIEEDELAFNEAAKLIKINELKSKGFEKNDIARVLAKNLTEDEAFLLESFLIKTVYGFDKLTNKVHGKYQNRFRQHNSLEYFNDYDEFLVGRKKINQSRDHIATAYINQGKDQPLKLIAQQLPELNFSDLRVLDAGEFGMEASVNGIANLKIYIRSKFIYIELWPRKKSEKTAIVKHFESLGISDQLKRNDLVFRPVNWSLRENRTNDINEIVRRARLLIEFLNTSSPDEINRFDELFEWV